MKEIRKYPELRLDRHASALVHDEANSRVVFFALAPGQQVPVHTSASTVVVTVTHGSGTFVGQDSKSSLAIGESAVYQPNEPHGMTAGEQGLRFVAVISPSPARDSGNGR
ncbi:MAG TPA: hypothetical protein VGC44_05205 [Longimicrobiales bacterium]